MADPQGRETIGATLYETLRRDIITCRLEPGARLPLRVLHERYGASVSTLREVLGRLVADGLAEDAAQRGFFVAPLTRAGLNEIADLRLLVETHAIRRSFAAGDTEWEGRLVAAHHKLTRLEERVKQGDVSVRERWKRYDYEFHQALIGACGSDELIRLHGQVFDKYLRYQMRFLTYRGETAQREHAEMLEAALERDVPLAVGLLEAHIAGGVADALEQIDNGTPVAPPTG